MPRLRPLALLVLVLALLGSSPDPVNADPTPIADPPVLAQPADLVVEAVDAGGTALAFAPPEAVDATDGAVAVVCDPVPGARFPLGTTTVRCTATDAAGNRASVAFAVSVVDRTPPVLDQPTDVATAATDPAGAVVSFVPPAAVDAVDGAVVVVCDPVPGAQFPVGASVVRCGARDASGNAATPVTFRVVIDPAPTPAPTAVPDEPTAAPPTSQPTATEPAAPTESADAPPTAASAKPTDPALPTATPQRPVPAPAATDPATVPPAPDATDPPVATARAATTTPVPTPTVEPSANGPRRVAVGRPSPTVPTATPTATALTLPWPLPDSFVIVTDGGPLGGLAAIWNNTEDFPISQEFGHTDFSVTHGGWYAYGAGYGLDGFEHPGIDIGMPAGTPLYSPIEGTVKIAGGVPYYTFYGNGQPGVGELLIEADNGDEVILGHMGRITVAAGERVVAGQFVGLSGGDNGDHLHLETREGTEQTGYKIVDPRKSFLIEAIAKADTTVAEQAQPNAGDPHRRYEVSVPTAAASPTAPTATGTATAP